MKQMSEENKEEIRTVCKLIKQLDKDSIKVTRGFIEGVKAAQDMYEADRKES